MRTICCMPRKTRTSNSSMEMKCGFIMHPEKYGMVVMPNIKGRVTEVLPCIYYRVLYNTLEGTECTATLYGSMMVLGRPSPTENEQCTDALASVQSLTLQNVTEKVFSHALKMCESIHDFGLSTCQGKLCRIFVPR